jgi:hypothetical protein
VKRVVFYSWQSDSPTAIHRNLVEDALSRAVRAIRRDDTATVEPVVDRDTAGVPGSPAIADSIYAKIAEADVFVADVTIVNPAAPERWTLNPNILVELGNDAALRASLPGYLKAEISLLDDVIETREERASEEKGKKRAKSCSSNRRRARRAAASRYATSLPTCRASSSVISVWYPIRRRCASLRNRASTDASTRIAISGRPVDNGLTTRVYSL